jgi:hypothetical protein
LGTWATRLPLPMLPPGARAFFDRNDRKNNEKTNIDPKHPTMPSPGTMKVFDGFPDEHYGQ